MSARLLWILILLTLLAPVATSRGQDGDRALAPEEPSDTEAKQDPQPSSSDPKKLSDEGGSPLLYLLTRDGQLVLASNITYEELQEYFDRKQGLQQENAAPPFALRQTDVTATVRGDVVDLTIQVEFEVTTDVERTIPIPLQLGDVVRPQFQYRGEGKQFVVYERGGYLCWISAPAGSKHRLTIKAMTPIVRNDETSRFSLALPYAPSRMQVDVPMADAEFAVSDPRSTLASKQSARGRTQATVDGRGGEVEIRWSPASMKPKTQAPLIFADTSLNVRIENALLLRVDAEVEARAARGELSEFEILLPDGVKLTQRRAVGYTVSEPMALPGAGGSVVRVRLDTPALRAPMIRLSGEITRTPEDAEQPIDVWGFEVLGANQTGQITLLTGDAWVVTPVQGGNVRRDRAPPDNPRSSANALRFTVVSQPTSLRIAIRQKPVRVVVDPTYHLDVEPTKSNLELRLLCRFGNGSPLDLELPLEGWTVRELLPQRLNDATGEFEVRDQKLIIPLGKVTDAPMGDVEVIVRAERSHGEGEALELPLPAPQVSEFSPGLQLVIRDPLVVAAAANNVELNPELARMAELTPENVDQDALPEQWRSRQQAPIAFRADDAPVTFFALPEVRERSVVATSALDLRVAEGRVQATQAIRLEVLYEPLTRIRFKAPASLTSRDDFAVELEGQPLPLEDLDAEGFAVALPEGRLGEFTLTIAYTLNVANVGPGESVTISAPLITPDNERFTQAPPVLRCSSADNLRVELAAEETDWIESTTATRNNGRLEQTYQANASTNGVGLRIRSAEVVSGSITVDRMWVQTWLTPGGRRERAVFQVITPGDQLAVTLPQGVAADSVTLAVDGLQIDDWALDEGRLAFLMPEAGGKQRLVELWYQFASSRGPIGGMSLEMPAIESAARVNQFFWELITPRREHLFGHPNGLTAEMQWRRDGFAYGRAPLISSQQLAMLLGASPSATPRDANRYVFSSLDAVSRIEASTVRRSWLVFIAATAVLLLGVVWLTLRGGGRSFFFLALAVLIAAVATIYPNPAIVAAQAGFIGLAFVGLARLLRWAFWRSRRPGVEVRGTSLAPAATTSAPAVDSRASAPTATHVHATSETGA